MTKLEYTPLLNLQGWLCVVSLLTQIYVSQIRFLTWEIPADRYRRICVHMWKLGRVPSLLCYTEDTESVSWASPGTCSRTPALLVFTLSVYRDCRLLSSATRRWQSAYENWYSLANDTQACAPKPSVLFLLSFLFRATTRRLDPPSGWQLKPDDLSVWRGCQCSARALWWTEMMHAMRNTHSSCRV